MTIASPRNAASLDRGCRIAGPGKPLVPADSYPPAALDSPGNTTRPPVIVEHPGDTEIKDNDSRPVFPRTPEFPCSSPKAAHQEEHGGHHGPGHHGGRGDGAAQARPAPLRLCDSLDSVPKVSAEAGSTICALPMAGTQQAVLGGDRNSPSGRGGDRRAFRHDRELGGRLDETDGTCRSP